MVTCPLNTMSFDPAVCKSLLTSHNRVQSSSNSAELSALSAVTSLFLSVASFMRPDHTTPLLSTPGPKLCKKPASPMANNSPTVFNTPSKLERFLRSAEQNGIPGVVSFHLMLSEKGYGPDIMHLVSVADLGNCYVRVECSARLELAGYDQVALPIVNRASASGTW